MPSKNTSKHSATELLALEVLHDDMAGLRLFTPALHNNARAANNLYGLALFVVAAQTSPLTKGLGLLDCDQRNAMLAAQSVDELNVSLLVARVGQDAQVSLTSVESLHALAQTTSQTVVVQRSTKDSLIIIFTTQKAEYNVSVHH